MWLLYAFSGPLFWAVSTYIDKYLVERYFKDSDTTILIVFTALIGLAALPIICLVQGGVFSPHLTDILIMSASGVLYIGAMLFYLRALQAEEASIVAPLFQVSTLFTFLFGYLLLGEVLSWLQIGGGGLIIAGALLLSLDFSRRVKRLKPRLIVLMLICTIVLALSSVIFKYFAVRDDFWITTFWIYVGEGLFGLAILAIPRYRRQFTALFRKNPGAIIGINTANELINLGGSLGVRFAALSAPVAVVSAISSTASLFVFVFGVVLTVFFPKLGRENLNARMLLQKGLGAALIAGGVALINLRTP